MRQILAPHTRWAQNLIIDSLICLSCRLTLQAFNRVRATE
ncbi:hypothetical protein PATSB16_35280 [Pandoraea thiooxydans]|nr:hypothetical protein PATSB16_35280 [Pandoraea thiooxydans]